MSLFAGMSQQQLQAALTAAQNALIQLQSGTAAVSLSYTQGDGGKSVTRRIASIADCSRLIIQLQVALGIRRAPRARRLLYL